MGVLSVQRTTEPTATTAATTGDNAKVAAPVTNGEKTLAVTAVKTNDNQAAKPSKSPEPVSGKENSETKKSQKKLYHLRHKLQKLVYERKEVRKAMIGKLTSFYLLQKLMRL
jgi:hypothetical protein